MGEICSKFTIKAPQRRHWRLSDVFIINFERISHIVVVFPLFPLSKDIDMFEDQSKTSQKPNFNKDIDMFEEIATSQKPNFNNDIDMFEEIATSQKPNFNKLPNMKATVY